MINKQKESPVLEINVPVKTEVARLPDGNYVRRVTYQTGLISDTKVWPGDHPKARQIK